MTNRADNSNFLKPLMESHLCRTKTTSVYILIDAGSVVRSVSYFGSSSNKKSGSVPDV